MRTLKNLNWDSIDKSTPEGQALCTAVCMMAALCFPKLKPGIILEIVKDVRLRPFSGESLSDATQRIIEEYQDKYN
jgi:hypothetical protein